MTCSGCQQVKKSKEKRNAEIVKKVRKKKPSKKKVDLKKHKINHQNDKKKTQNVKAAIPPLKLKLSPHKSGHGQKYLIQKSDQKSRKARTRIALP